MPLEDVLHPSVSRLKTTHYKYRFFYNEYKYSHLAYIASVLETPPPPISCGLQTTVDEQIWLSVKMRYVREFETYDI